MNAIFRRLQSMLDTKRREQKDRKLGQDSSKFVSWQKTNSLTYLCEVCPFKEPGDVQSLSDYSKLFLLPRVLCVEKRNISLNQQEFFFLEIVQLPAISRQICIIFSLIALIESFSLLLFLTILIPLALTIKTFFLGFLFPFGYQLSYLPPRRKIRHSLAIGRLLIPKSSISAGIREGENHRSKTQCLPAYQVNQKLQYPNFENSFNATSLRV